MPFLGGILVHKILIIGNAGAGKSTFAKALSQKLGLPLVHLDKLYWCGQWEHVSWEVFNSLLQQELNKPAWIIDGNFNRTIPHRLQYCDTVFFLDMPTRTCLWGITKRIFTNYGKVRADMGGNCIERFDKQKINLYKNVLGFRKAHAKDYRDLLERQTHVRVITFHSRREIKKYLDKL